MAAKPQRLSKRARIVLVSVAVALLIGLSANAAARHGADTLTVTIHTRQSHEYTIGPHALHWSKAFRDSAAIGQVQDAINGAPAVPLSFQYGNHSCNLGGDTLYYFEFRFAWHGLTTQVATVNTETPSCAYWSVTTLGLPDPVVRRGFQGDTWRVIHDATNLPLPQWLLEQT